MSDDCVIFNVEASAVLVSSSLVFFGKLASIAKKIDFF